MPKDPLKKYREKRDFERTTEPIGSESTAGSPESEVVASSGPLFVIQKHAASHLHYDFRLEVAGVLKSWAIPKGPSLDPSQKRLAVPTEDHPLEYAKFEGVIPEGEYGGGTVMIWDTGTYRNLRWETEQDPADMQQSLSEGRVEIEIRGRKLKGAFVLVRTRMAGKENWLLIKKDDAEAKPGSDITASKPNSAVTGKNLDDIARASGPR